MRKARRAVSTPRARSTCEAGVFIEVPCRGPKGCAATDKAISCDIEKSREG
ncbi:MAG: hypothetical protein QM756_27645 [Polyangiaceae bacterium]